MVLSQGGRQLFVGLAAGLLAAIGLVVWFTGAYAGLFFGVNRFDPTIYGFVVGLLAVVAVVSCLIPALRATRVDPMVALRHD